MNIGVVYAGGVGKRMRSKDKPKQFLEIYNKPIIIYTLEHFERNPEIDAVVVVCIEDWIPVLRDYLYRFRIEKVRKIVPGGATGQLSIYNGLCAAEELAGKENALVLIHDGVRPLITPELLSEDIACVKEHGNAITAGIVKETIVVVDEEGRSVSMVLPHAVVLSINIPPELIRLEYEDVTGFRSHFDDRERQALLKQGEREIVRDLPKLGILTEAEANAEEFFRSMLTQMGFENIQINFE